MHENLQDKGIKDTEPIIQVLLEAGFESLQVYFS